MAFASAFLQRNFVGGLFLASLLEFISLRIPWVEGLQERQEESVGKPGHPQQLLASLPLPQPWAGARLTHFRHSATSPPFANVGHRSRPPARPALPSRWVQPSANTRATGRPDGRRPATGASRGDQGGARATPAHCHAANGPADYPTPAVHGCRACLERVARLCACGLVHPPAESPCASGARSAVGKPA